ncbi:primosomal protein DnaI [Cytobacillus spongiae]|uniref:primosomal protein DnaI n=1 Tax=Cytobacillus spongiae TaxID=2901381 RepID=UPI001F421B19|nr:primosomal protein DnaI [Cytobacillus spongiae]UII55136.1 primosomal protein DnaI [Cytobacillus spongiae]
MEKINKTIKRLAKSTNFQERYEQMRKQIMTHPEVRAFLIKHKHELTEEIVEKNLMKLYEYSKQSKECNQCPSLDGCINLMKGYDPELVLQRGAITIQYHECPRKVMHDERKKNEKLIQSLYIPKDILQASFGDIRIQEETPERIEAVSQAMAFVEDYEVGKKQKGLYLHGKFGVGKSYLLGAVANELAKKKVSTMIIYVPELLREMKSSIADSTLNTKIETIKKVPVIMFDDIGAETMSSWSRDEVLGPILQFRMLENLPTFFSSNFDYQELEHHLTYSQRGEEEKMKARRIMERIKYLTTPIKVDGPNRRMM